MAAGSADAFTAPRGFGCYDRGELDNLWSNGVVATASTGASWVDEVHNAEPLEKRLEDIKRKFHRGRVLQIKHLPREVTEEEVRELLAEWDVQTVTIQSGSARVSLCAPEVLEDWDRNAVLTVRGQRVTIVPSLTEMLLCIGRLPLSYSEAQFNSLVSSYGEVRRVFLMISERTGESKGYGFVEYVTKEAALQAKNALDGKRILDGTAVCDWLDSSHVTVRSLHSKCLYVDRLPPNYRDMGEFRRVFSTIVNPPYCQIALKNGCPQDWGLVEFIGEEDAEKTQQNLDGYSLHGSRIRVAYYIPGVRAINLYLKLLNDGGANKGKSALLPDPPAPAVFHQLQSLAKQNPVFAQNLQTIIMQQIQDLQKGKVQEKRAPFQKPPPPPFGNSSNGNKSAQALTLLLASQAMQQQGNGGGGNNGGGQMSPNSQQLQNQQLLAALQAMSSGGKGGGGGGMCGGNDFSMPSSSNISNLLGLATPPNGMQMDNNIPHPFYQSSQSSLLSPNGGSKGNMAEDQWNQFKSSNRSTPVFGSNGMHKSPLLPSPSGLSSPSLDVPMDTGTPKTPPGGDPLSAMWYSLFGQNADSAPSSPGNTSPHFLKNSSSSNNGSPIGRSADALFSMSHHHHHHHQYKNTPPGFSGGPQQQQMNHHRMEGVNGELQEALNTLLNNPQSLNQMFNQEPPPMSPYSHMRHMPQQQQQMQRQNSFSNNDHHQQQMPNPNAILDLLMQSMKGEQQQQQQQQQQQEGFGKQNSWSSGGMSNPPSPIGNNRSFMGQQAQPQRNGSNGSSEMSSPRSPTYSPFSRNSSKGLLESGNGNASPTSTWSSAVLGSPPHSGGFIGGTNHPHNSFNSQSRNIWATRSVSPGATSLNNNNNLLNPLGIKRKVHHETQGADGGDFLLTAPPMGFHHHPLNTHTSPHQDRHPTNTESNPHSQHYADSYYKKKKKL